jgi:hypothetical protein
MNRKSRHRSNIGYTRHTKNANKTGKHSTAYKIEMKNHAREGLYLIIYRLFIYITNGVHLILYFFLK